MFTLKKKCRKLLLLLLCCLPVKVYASEQAIALIGPVFEHPDLFKEVQNETLRLFNHMIRLNKGNADRLNSDRWVEEEQDLLKKKGEVALTTNTNEIEKVLQEKRFRGPRSILKHKAAQILRRERGLFFERWVVNHAKIKGCFYVASQTLHENCTTAPLQYDFNLLQKLGRYLPETVCESWLRRIGMGKLPRELTDIIMRYVPVRATFGIRMILDSNQCFRFNMYNSIYGEFDHMDTVQVWTVDIGRTGETLGPIKLNNDAPSMRITDINNSFFEKLHIDILTCFKKAIAPIKKTAREALEMGALAQKMIRATVEL